MRHLCQGPRTRAEDRVEGVLVGSVDLGEDRAMEVNGVENLAPLGLVKLIVAHAANVQLDD